MKGVILAGGGSTRFGSFKGAAPLGKHSVLEHIAQQLSLVTEEVYVNGPPSLKTFGYPVIEDISVDQGPLHGIHSCFTSLKDDLLIVSCDMPLITVQLLERLLDQDRSACFDLDGQLLPMPGFYAKKDLGSISSYTGDRLTEFVKAREFKIIGATTHQAAQLQSFNTQEEFEELSKRITEFRLHGQLAELLPSGSVVGITPDKTGLHDLKAHLSVLVKGIDQFDFQLASNGQLLSENVTIDGGTTIEVMPPFSGG